jgi:hypothetical protein
MTRCQSCDGILTKDEEACYHCGDPVPENAKSSGAFSLLLIGAGLIVSFGFAAYSFL